MQRTAAGVTCQGCYDGYTMTDTHEAPAEPASDEELFTEFANTLHLHDGEPDDIGDAASLRSWLASHALVRETRAIDAVEAALPAFHDLRRLIHDVTRRLVDGRDPSAVQVRRLNGVLRDGLHYHQLRPGDNGSRFTVGQIGDDLAQARAAIAGSLAHYIADHDTGRLRICANDECSWRFVDRSPAGRRRWCDMRTCGNRAKVARHRARARQRSA
jgi:predicted RNA-binding Zn ribbon-like protein